MTPVERPAPIESAVYTGSGLYHQQITSQPGTRRQVLALTQKRKLLASVRAGRVKSPEDVVCCMVCSPALWAGASPRTFTVTKDCLRFEPGTSGSSEKFCLDYLAARSQQRLMTSSASRLSGVCVCTCAAVCGRRAMVDFRMCSIPGMAVLALSVWEIGLLTEKKNNAGSAINTVLMYDINTPLKHDVLHLRLTGSVGLGSSCDWTTLRGPVLVVSASTGSSAITRLLFCQNVPGAQAEDGGHLTPGRGAGMSCLSVCLGYATAPPNRAVFTPLASRATCQTRPWLLNQHA
ncbi:hypothetical protein EGW08_005965 [Elysia chlorotica]|uniref:Uncharacterized protein n=1 Tax=Elysia chlorotica TaxID=188477 RepID=A0A433TXF2_ELYCH|nr:hypothetical protein EGW08_005965 [Elysia chlorotica]